ncbi:conserved hypothetical protein [Leishmania braziliensis MHOM/BR/75/M2904]|uniref:Thioredoxin-like fold domain-containing protein n=2 Tax=Leishmania braziliensis TaxID=5660 RepID=A4HDM2_LEIBR|nr:conserved hypothetical protein [Leishmania braziliensis MHOM/BR/75/M2904]KAI5688213.1 hypothetical protein MNV84_04255 [Leishmania braziliensis]CAJ2473777.1 unnamed protein product [Leishmania braziliensis]CAJ2474291.1 unnamed protein product [Leishmania braziliensis]CAM42343.1 conserved hypothetical protein [Leishmania braziliensis MHOM/BR/75/M2904]SYZ66334.1 hypothetical_protein [Leishmania braziliensis MHOM/BR/75/M2904]
MKLSHFEGLFGHVHQSISDTVSTARKHIFPWTHKEVAKTRKESPRLTPSQRRLAIGASVVVGALTTYTTLSRLFTLFARRRWWQLIQQCEARETELFLFILPRSPWAPSLSPACTRMEAFLRANGIPYKAIETIDPLGAPNGELPFLIYKRQRIDQLPKMMELITSEFNVTMDDTLTRDQRAMGAFLRRTLEYSVERFLYRIVFIDHPSLAVVQVARALHISHLRARLAVHCYAIELKKRLGITAYGALASEQYENEFLQDCEVIEAQIGYKRYLFSDTNMTSYDCAIYSLLVPFAYLGDHTLLSATYSTVAGSTVLMAYITRISKRLFSDTRSGFDVARISFAVSIPSGVGGGGDETVVESGEEEKREVVADKSH